MTPSARRDLRNGLLFTLPWIIGFSVFILYPVVSSIVYSFCEYSVLSPPRFIGLANYRELWNDPVFFIAVSNTLTFASLSIGVTFVPSLGRARPLASDKRGVRLYRTLFCVPVLIPQVAVAYILLWVFKTEDGLVNITLEGLFGVKHPPNWISKPWIMTTLVIASIWSIGNAMIIYIAGLKDVPRQYYEAADIDGAGIFRKAWFISLPMISPMILFNLVMGVIGAFNVFAVPYFITSGNTSYDLGHAITFYSPLINRQALDHLRMGYASAMAWILFLVVFALTLVIMRFGMKRVHYGGGIR